MKNPRINESLIIGVDFSERDNGVLIVGRQKNGEVTIYLIEINQCRWNRLRL